VWATFESYMATLPPSPFFTDAPEVGIPTTKSAPVHATSQNTAEMLPKREPAGTGADTRFRLNVQAFTYAIDQRSVDWDPLPMFIADPSPEYLEIVQRTAE